MTNRSDTPYGEFADHHDKQWYRDEAMRIAQIALHKFGADMDGADRTMIADEIYRAVNGAILRHGQVRANAA